MNRFNYLPNDGNAVFRLRLSTVAIDNRIRGPLAALLGTLVLTATLSMIQLVRLHAAQQAYTAAALRLAEGEAQLPAVNVLRERVAGELRLSARVDEIRNASLGQANELTWIGNHLPVQAWLVAVRYEDGSYSLEGTSDRSATVGAAMIALRDPARPTLPQLIWLHDDGSAGSARVHYRLRLQTLR